MYQADFSLYNLLFYIHFFHYRALHVYLVFLAKEKCIYHIWLLLPYILFITVQIITKKFFCQAEYLQYM